MSHDPVKMADDFAVAEANRDLDDRVQAIRARLAAATPGPWRWRGHKNQCIELRGARFGDVVLAPERSGFHWTAFKVSVKGLLYSIREFAVLEVPYRQDIVGVVHPDAELIANAPADIAYLLGEVDRWRDDAALAAGASDMHAERAALMERERDGALADLYAARGREKGLREALVHALDRYECDFPNEENETDCGNCPRCLMRLALGGEVSDG